ncbi:MAG: twin-arginine translocation signal domain-containing protein, partial [Acidimicrobiia bacterium]
MPTSRRDFLKAAGASMAAAGTLTFDARQAVARGELSPARAGLNLETLPETGKAFRMTEAWYRQQIKNVQQKLGERGLN